MLGPIDPGGFVFPAVVDEGQPNACPSQGITRRDWLAGIAMGGLVANMNQDKNSMHPVTALEVARSAYHLADLMIRLSREEEAMAAKLASEASVSSI